MKKPGRRRILIAAAASAGLAGDATARVVRFLAGTQGEIITPPPPPVITSSLSADGMVGIFFSYSITASNSPTSYDATGLPGGLGVDTTSGVIFGTPTAAGTTNITLSASNAGGTGSDTLVLTVSDAIPSAPVITSSLSAGGTVGSGFSYSITASNSPTSYNATGLPGGLGVDTGSGVISGTPTSAGTTGVTISASNAGGTGSDTLVLTISPSTPPAPAITSSLSASGTVGSGFSYSITATNSPTSFNATGLPGGLGINTSSGVISGTPTSAATTNIGLSASNAGGTGSATLVLTVSPAATVGGSDLRVSSNAHYLETISGSTPFFFLSDTEWVLNLRNDGDVATILNDRQSKGFTVVQVFGTRAFQFDGSGDISHDANGNLPFISNDPVQFNSAYWDRWRSIVDQAASRGLHFLLVYGEPGKFDNGVGGANPWRITSTAVAYEYGRLIGDRFKDKSNVIFADGQDSNANVDAALFRAMAEGVADGVNNVNNNNGSADYSNTMQTYHGYNQPSEFHFDSWLDFYGTEVFGNVAGQYDEINNTYNMTGPTKPVALLEGNYEASTLYPDSSGVPVDARSVRLQVYHVFFAGGMGYAYGHNDNYRPPFGIGYLGSSGANGMSVFSTFMRARNWWRFFPNQSLIVSGAGSGTSRKAAVQSADGNQCLIYYPSVASSTIDMGGITTSGSVGATWFDPRNGSTSSAGTFLRTQQVALTPPGGFEDAVLILAAI
jgi:hypothetical protein